jgi:amidase
MAGMADRRAGARAEGQELWRWGAGAVARAIRRREISSRELVMSCLERIDAVNPRLNALVDVRAEAALADADAADTAIRESRHVPPLHGVPVAIKVNTDQAGHATTDGIVAFRDHRAERDAPPVARLREAGAVLLGRSNASSLSFRWFTDNDLHGRTLNPWDPGRTAGGSSGGAACAVASGMVPLAHGTDLGGSIRYPAFACGVVGLRPTVGVVPSWRGRDDADQGLMFQLMNAQGILARDIAGARLALDAMRGFDPRDPGSLPAEVHAPSPAGVPRVGIVRGAQGPPRAGAVDAALDIAAGALTAAGHAVEELDVPQLTEAHRLWYLLVLTELRQRLALIDDVGDEGLRTAARLYLEVGAEWWGPDPALPAYIAGYARRGTLIRDLQEVLATTPLLLTPVSAEPPFEHDADLRGVDGMRCVVAAQWPMTAVATLGLPAVAVPTGMVDGLPTGVQVIGARFAERSVLAAAGAIEAAAGALPTVGDR